MVKPKSKFTEKATQEVADTKLETKELKEAFNVFNGVADQLTSSYRALEDHISNLNQELNVAQSGHSHEAEEKERLAARLGNLLEALPAGVIVIDNRGCIKDANPAANEILGVELLNVLWREVIEQVFHAGSLTGQEAVTNTGRWVSISTCPLVNEPGQIIMINDITEARTLQTALERYKRLSAMGEMSAKVAHQIRTPLASALLYTSNLTKRGIKEEDRNRFADKALDRMRHLEKVVNDMLSFTRDSSAIMAEVDLGQMLRDLSSFMDTQLGDGACELIIEPLVHEDSMRANRDALLSVMQNLISNSIQACGDGGKIHVVVDQRQQHQAIPAIDIYFSDNGPGISEDDQKRIFEPFYTTKTQGTGLGLAVAQNVVQSHGGSLWIANSGESGTTFVMRLPIIVNQSVKSADHSTNSSIDSSITDKRSAS